MCHPIAAKSKSSSHLLCNDDVMCELGEEIKSDDNHVNGDDMDVTNGEI